MDNYHRVREYPDSCNGLSKEMQRNIEKGKYLKLRNSQDNGSRRSHTWKNREEEEVKMVWISSRMDGEWSHKIFSTESSIEKYTQ